MDSGDLLTEPRIGSGGRRSEFSIPELMSIVEKETAAPDKPDPGDVFAQLEQKERDLVLAAELGKALLEKNEELSQQNEKMTEDFCQKLEVRFPCFGII